MKIHEALQIIADQGPFDDACGICWNLRHNAGNGHAESMEADDAWDTFRLHRQACYEAWPHYSGDKVYPVPDIALQFEGDPSEAYFDAGEYPVKVWKEGPYAAARRDLLAHMIQWFKERDI